MKTFIKTKHAIALLLIVTAGIPAVLLADSFTPAEKREITRRRKSVRLYARP